MVPPRATSWHLRRRQPEHAFRARVDGARKEGQVSIRFHRVVEQKRQITRLVREIDEAGPARSAAARQGKRRRDHDASRDWPRSVASGWRPPPIVAQEAVRVGEDRERGLSWRSAPCLPSMTAMAPSVGYQTVTGNVRVGAPA